MPHYQIQLTRTRTITETTEIEVEAGNEAGAREIAAAREPPDPEFWIESDFEIGQHEVDEITEFEVDESEAPDNLA